MAITSIKAQFITLTWLEFTIYNMLVALSFHKYPRAK